MLCSLSGVSALMIQSHTYYTGINRLYSGLLWPCYSGKIQKMSFSSFPVSTVNEFFSEDIFSFMQFFVSEFAGFINIYMSIYEEEKLVGGWRVKALAVCPWLRMQVFYLTCSLMDGTIVNPTRRDSLQYILFMHFHFWKCLSSTFLTTKRECALSLDTLSKVRTFSLSRVKF